ncbi:MAG: OmpA family protein [Ginsengibacter sp.]
MKKYLVVIVGMFLLSSCVAKRYLTQSQNQVSSLRADSVKFENKITAIGKIVSSLETKIANLEKDIAEREKQIGNLNAQNSQLGKQTEEQQNKLKLSQQKLQQLQDLLAEQKAASDRLKNKMSEALQGFNSNELTVHQKDGKVYVSLSESLLFPSGSAVVNPKGVDALSKLAAVLNLNADVAVNIEGHTDSIPIRGKYQDNWELSTARANSIVRILVNNYKVDPNRVISSGHSYFDPVDTNGTSEGRANNRRTEIILSPKLEEMYQLLGQQ